MSGPYKEWSLESVVFTKSGLYNEGERMGGGGRSWVISGIREECEHRP